MNIRSFFSGLLAAFALCSAAWGADEATVSSSPAASENVSASLLVFNADTVRQVYVFDREGFDELEITDVPFTVVEGYVGIQDVEFFVAYHRRSPRNIVYVCRPVQENDKSYEMRRTKQRIQNGCTRYG